MSSSPVFDRAPGFKASLGWALALVGLVFAAYSTGLRGPFVYDDVQAIQENTTIRHLGQLGTILLPQSGGGLTVSGRPVLNLSFALNYAVSENRPWSYHGLNVLIHTGSALLLFGIVRRTLQLPRWHGRFRNKASAIAAVSAALWALHPLQTQAITYTVQRAESLMGFFYLLTLYAFVRAASPSHTSDETDGHRRWWAAGAVIAALLGMGTKEVMATAPLLVLLYDRTFIAGSFAEAWRARRGLHLAIAATWLFLALLVISTGGNRGGTVGVGVAVPWWAYGLTQFQAVGRYLELAVWPRPLIFEYGTFWVQRVGEILPYAFLLVPLVGLTIWGLVRKPVVGFFGTWFFGIMAPSSLAPGTIQMIVEHRPYLSLAAVMIPVAVGLFALCGRKALLVSAALALVATLLTSARNHDYRSSEALWRDTVAKRPENPRGHAGLADAYDELGQMERAIAERRETVRLRPDEAQFHYNLGATLSKAGRMTEALQSYRMAEQLDPQEPSIRNNLAIAIAEAGDPAAALPHYEAAEKLRPKDAQLHYNHALSLQRLNRGAEAIEQYRVALQLKPEWADAELNWGSALAMAGKMEEAIPHYARAAKLAPTDLEIRLTYANALLVARQREEAAEEFRGILARAAGDESGRAKAWFGLGTLAAAEKQTDVAIGYYEKALHADPAYANAYYKLGNALMDADRVADAVPPYTAAIRLAPNDAESHHNLGVAYARLERFEEARVEFETAVKLKPDYGDAQKSLARVRGLLGR